ncbi:MAG: hypothetical protein AAGG75_01930 [Bacteroidota bacterium]
MKVNLFYISVLLLGIGLFTVLRPRLPGSDLSFYGFAESNETEINYNYPVVVDRILITPGQSVKAGDTLMLLSRRPSEASMEDQTFRMAELKAEETIWRQKKKQQLAELELDRDQRAQALALKIRQKEEELKRLQKIADNLVEATSTVPQEAFQPIQEELAELEEEQRSLAKNYDLQIVGIREELRLGDSPYREQIKRLTAEQAFEASQKEQRIVVRAPNNGLIGNISCKEEEHIPAYTTLLSFYEPHSGIIKGYVHEDLTLRVKIGDAFRVASLKEESIQYSGKVIGLGSRIVEIPTRLRKLPEIKTYGREVLVAISKDNQFLQKEKVSLNPISSPTVPE